MEDNQKDKYFLAMQAYKEDDFTKEILTPLFKSMGYDRVEFHGGPSERGRDLIATAILPPPKRGEYVVYIQAKKLNKNKMLARNDLSRLCRQLRQAKSKGFTKGNGDRVKPDHIYIATPHAITQRFIEDLEDELFDDGYRGWLELYDCVRILKDIEEFCPDLLEKLEPFEEKIWNAKSENIVDRNHELLGALCSVRDSIDISKFYSDLSFFVGSIDSRVLVTYKAHITKKRFRLINKKQWESLKLEREKIIDLVGLDILKEDTKVSEDRYKEHYNQYNSKENKANQLAYNSSVSHLSSLVEEFDSRAFLLLGRLEFEAKKQSRSNKLTLELITDKLRNVRSKVKNDNFKLERSCRGFDTSELSKESVDLAEKAFELINDFSSKIVEQQRYVKLLKEDIIPEPYYDVCLNSSQLEKEISQRVEEYRSCVKFLNSDDRPNMAGVRRLLDSVEISLRFFGCIYTDESVLSSIIELKELEACSDRVSISAHDVFYTGKDVAIYGGAGVGKTTTLEMFFKSYEETINGRKIIFCSLNRVVQGLSNLGIEKRNTKDTKSTYLDKVIYSIILLSYGLAVNSDNIDRIKPYLDDGVVLVFDGLDEIITEYPIVLDAMNNFKKNYEKIQWIISSRDCVSYLKEINFLGITLLPFTPEQLRSFICGWFNDECIGMKLWNEISGTELHENLLTPLVATILCTLVEKGIKAPSNESEIYSERLSLLLGKYDTNKRIRRQEQGSEELFSCAKALAWSMHSQGIRNISYREAIQNLQIKVGSKYTTRLISKCVKELEDPCTVLVRDKVSGKLSFGHFRFQEHLASLELRDNRSIDLSTIIIRDWWRGAFSLFAQSLDDIESTIEELIRGDKLISEDAFTTLYTMCDVLSSKKRGNMRLLLDHLKQDNFYCYETDNYDFSDNYDGDYHSYAPVLRTDW
ncbi:hypothetical protein PVK64_03075 [Aliivibrio sp. S4TY2]|uniref:hypothetical protein n=1 Tax=unclassified Aliivibrio TaxID=2645654 RepID=UPI0023794B90|nr:MULTISPECIES: hypothetical protein [unclassified Aliivibrio]MDD9155174.1 hypothetical protein [Aliivibrio sp. S4TY2]MDD9159274.1 hypothetical protein [Aliivibrio sp. S4TY1]MDD9163176.1 hypothetical protein [Aliivibrio sp. S4MY2]MDD9167273.1 hypothetical protein [Aliivibrio sp. S4MY4]MDD9175148.1 hypothetical protein [Aliivibrio sp. S3TY1]